MSLRASFIRGITWLCLVACVGLLSSTNRTIGTTGSGTYATQNVVILSICGMRNVETFRNPDASPTYHPYMPGIWTQLVPQGTLYSQFYNLKDPWTTPGHHNLISGAWQFGPNAKYFGLDTDARSMEPTVFEAYRKSCGAPASDTWAVVGGANLINVDHSFHPLFGPDHEALVERAPPHPELGVNNDGETYLGLIEKLQQDRPRLALAVLKAIDYGGHTGSWDDYLQTIIWADQVAVDLWNWLQGDSFYAGQTTLIIVSDHGRHDIGEGDPSFALNWKDHGGTCYGCRDCFLLVLGPDTPAGQVATGTRFHTDVAPTVAELLGFELPYSEGTILDEAIGQAVIGPVAERRPDLEASGGACHMVYETHQNGSSQVWYRRSEDAGQTYSVELQLSSQTFRAERPQVLVDGNQVLVVWIDYKDFDVTNTFASPQVYLRRSENGGQSFFPEQVILSRPLEVAKANTRVEGGQRISDLGFSRVSGEHALAVALQTGRIYFLYSSDGFSTSFESYEIDRSWPDPTRETSYPQDICLAPLSTPSNYAAVWADISWGADTLALNYEIGMKRGDASFSTADTTATRLTTSPSPSLQPSLASDESGHLYLAYADRPRGRWQVYVMTSGDDGATWSQPPIQVSASKRGAWEPSVVALDTGALVAYSDLASGEGDIFLRWFDGTTWRQPLNVSDTLSISRRPVLARDGLGTLFVAWEEQLSGGGWEVRMAPITKMEGPGRADRFSSQKQPSTTSPAR